MLHVLVEVKAACDKRLRDQTVGEFETIKFIANDVNIYLLVGNTVDNLVVTKSFISKSDIQSVAVRTHV